MDLTPQQLAKYLALTRKRGARTLSILGQRSKFIDAINTGVGQELMGELIDKHEQLLDKISAVNASEEDKIRYGIVKEILEKWAEKIDGYNRKIKEIKDTIA